MKDYRASMEFYTGSRFTRRSKSALVYVLLFLVPAAIVFVLVQMHFGGLPPRYQTKMVFRVDPNLSPGETTEDGESAPSLLVDVQSIKIEIKSRERMQEALAGLAIYEGKKSEEKRQLFLEQVIEQMHPKVERETGQDAYLVHLTLTLPSDDPDQLKELLLEVRNVYMKYNVEQRISKVLEQKTRLGRQQSQLETDLSKRIKLLDDFLVKRRELLETDLVKALSDLDKRLLRVESPKDEKEVKERDFLEGEREKLRKQQKTKHDVERKLSELREGREEAVQLRDDAKKKYEAADNYLTFLQDKSQNRFEIVQLPESEELETEQTSRLLLGLALAIMAGLVVVLLVLLLGILGGD